MIARVRGVIAASMAAGSSVSRAGSMSANTGVAPAITIARALKAAESGAVITSSPAPMPSARSVSASASVPVPTPTANRAPDAAANSSSNADTSGPRMNHPRSITRSMPCAIAAASGPGVSDRNGTREVMRSSSPAGRLDDQRRRGRAAGSAADARLRRLPRNKHQLHPQPADAGRGPNETADIEKLRLSKGAVVVMDRDFRDAEPGVLNLLHHLQTDDAAVVFERHAIEDPAPDQAEVAVHVAHRQPEQRLHGVVIHASDHNPVQRIGSTDLVAVDQVHAVDHVRPQHLQLFRIVLRIAVGVEHEILPRIRETAAQRAAVAAILRMVNDPDFGIGAGQLVGDLGRAIGAAVVDDDDLEVRRQPRGRLARGDHQARDRPAVVVGGKKHGQADRARFGTGSHRGQTLTRPS